MSLAKSTGARIRIEYRASEASKERPGDVALLKFDQGKDILIDVTFPNPLAASHLPTLLAGGPGAVAEKAEHAKLIKYGHIDGRRQMIVAWGCEITGALGRGALMGLEMLI